MTKGSFMDLSRWSVRKFWTISMTTTTRMWRTRRNFGSIRFLMTKSITKRFSMLLTRLWISFGPTIRLVILWANEDGPPYPWNNSEKALTFYFIAEENIREVFEKTQFKLLKWASSMCGIVMNRYDKNLYSNKKSSKDTEKPEENLEKIGVEDALAQYRESTHNVVVEIRE